MVKRSGGRSDATRRASEQRRQRDMLRAFRERSEDYERRRLTKRGDARSDRSEARNEA